MTNSISWPSLTRPNNGRAARARAHLAGETKAPARRALNLARVRADIERAPASLASILTHPIPRGPPKPLSAFHCAAPSISMGRQWKTSEPHKGRTKFSYQGGDGPPLIIVDSVLVLSLPRGPRTRSPAGPKFVAITLTPSQSEHTLTKPPPPPTSNSAHLVGQTFYRKTNKHSPPQLSPADNARPIDHWRSQGPRGPPGPPVSRRRLRACAGAPARGTEFQMRWAHKRASESALRARLATPDGPRDTDSINSL